MTAFGRVRGRPGPWRGRARTRPDAVIADTASFACTIRHQLRGRGITAVIPEKSDTIAARARRGSRGSRGSRGAGGQQTLTLTSTRAEMTILCHCGLTLTTDPDTGSQAEVNTDPPLRLPA